MREERNISSYHWLAAYPRAETLSPWPCNDAHTRLGKKRSEEDGKGTYTTYTTSAGGSAWRVLISSVERRVSLALIARARRLSDARLCALSVSVLACSPARTVRARSIMYATV